VQVHQPDVLEQLVALDARLLVVSFADAERLRQWIPFFRRRFLEPTYGRGQLAAPADPFVWTRFLADPARTAYHTYGLGRNAVLRVYGPRILWQYVKWGVQGKPIRIRDDTLQRGGDFVVGRDGHLTLAHSGRDQSERPSASAIVAGVRQG
jgi:hypothetical protein